MRGRILRILGIILILVETLCLSSVSSEQNTFSVNIYMHVMQSNLQKTNKKTFKRGRGSVRRRWIPLCRCIKYTQFEIAIIINFQRLFYTFQSVNYAHRNCFPIISDIKAVHTSVMSLKILSAPVKETSQCYASLHRDDRVQASKDPETLKFYNAGKML